MPPDDLFEIYLQMLGVSESPNTYHRWSFLAVLGAWLGRKYHLPFGDSNINCNMYVMLMGNAGARKSTAIHKAVKFIKAVGYSRIAASKTSKEKFLLDLAGENLTDPSEIMESNIFGSNLKDDSEILIAADEFNVFMGNGNLEFLSLLGTLWDYDGVFDHAVKTTVGAVVNNPTISMIAGNTATSFALAFPIEAIGQGIFSRLLLIHGEKTNRRITIPPPMNPELKAQLIETFHFIQKTCVGAAKFGHGAYDLIDKIYGAHRGITDIRFESYNNRRLTHLLKLCLLISATYSTKTITEFHVIKANTILTHAEHGMPKALGEFGKAKNSDIANKVLSALEEAPNGLPNIKGIWKQVCNDLESVDQLKQILGSLQLADKIMSIQGGGFVAKKIAVSHNSDTVDFSLLTNEEKGEVVL